MTMHLTPLSLAISSAFLLSVVPVWSAGGEAGANGQTFVNGILLNESDRISSGARGGDYSGTGEAISNGENGADISEKHVDNASLGAVTGSSLAISGSVGSPGGDATSKGGGGGAAGQGGGSVFGGISQGGAGGYASSYSASASASASGGSGRDIFNNRITLSGVTSISGDIYGGISQGGDRGQAKVGSDPVIDGQYGKGGKVYNNTITLIGNQISIAGSIYGGLSIDGGLNLDGSQKVNKDPDFTSYYQGNTLNLEAFRGSVKGIHNVEIYNWALPDDVVNNDTIIHITGNEPVNLNNTKHTVTINPQGNLLKKGDQVTLIDKAEGQPSYMNNEALPMGVTKVSARIGYLLLQNSQLEMIRDGAVLTMLGDAITNPKAKVFLERRVASIAMNNQGADMMADYSMDASACKNTLFTVVDGGSSRYKIKSRVDLRDIKLALGGAHCFELSSQSKLMLGGFFEYGHANFDSYSKFDGEPDVHGWGKQNYKGVGVLLHMNVAGTSQSRASKPLIEGKDGLYINAVLRGGSGKSDFDTDDLRNEANTSPRYDAKSPYYSAMAGFGYAINFNDQHALDVYGRYTWSKVNVSSVRIGDERLDFEASTSSRVRLGARYRFAATSSIVPYAGLAYEREFSAKVLASTLYQGKKYEVTPIHLKGNTGVAELGMTVTPVGRNDALTLNLGVQGYFGKREGASVSAKLKYAF